MTMTIMMMMISLLRCLLSDAALTTHFQSNLANTYLILKCSFHKHNQHLYLFITHQSHHQTYLLTLGVSDELPWCLFHISVKLLSLSLINWPLERL